MLSNNEESALIVHQRSLSYLINQEKMPHAFIISGSPNTEKLTLANWLISVLACEQCNHTQQSILIPCGQCKSCQLVIGQGHPDHLIVDHSSNTIGVDQIRKVISFFEKTALLGKRQTAIIECAEKMTESAANALLKTLEEPTANSHIILLTTEIERLLPTIISRCRHLALRAIHHSSSSNLANTTATFACFSQESDGDDFNEFMALFYQFIAKPTQRSNIVEFMQAQSKSLSWCEKLIIDLMRLKQGWLTVDPANKVAPEILERLQQLTHDDIWHVQCLISTTKKQILTLTQANKDFQIEKLLGEVRNYLIRAYAVNR